MEFHFSTKTDEVDRIENRLKQMTLAYTISVSEEAIVPFLKDGSKEYHGIDKMDDYLDLLDREKEQWYYCNC